MGRVHTRPHCRQTPASAIECRRLTSGTAEGWRFLSFLLACHEDIAGQIQVSRIVSSTTSICTKR